MIRAATLDDVGTLVGAYDWLFAPPGSRPAGWDAERAAAALRRAILSERAEVLVAVAGGDGEGDSDEAAVPGAGGGEAIVGICTAYLDIESVRFGQRAFIEDLAVDPNHRSAGHGKALLDAAKAWARAHEATHLELDSADARTDAHRFYDRENPSWQSRSFGWVL